MYCYAFILLFIIISTNALDQSLSFNYVPAKATAAKSVRITRSTISTDTNVFPSTEVIGNNNFQQSNSYINSAFAPFSPSTIQTGSGSILSSSATSSFSPFISNSNIQASSTSRNPFAASGISTSSSTSSLNNNNFNDLTKSFLSIPGLSKFHDLKISGSEAASTLTDLSSIVLKGIGHPDADLLAPLVGQHAAAFENFQLPIFFQAAGNTFEKFFKAQGIPIPPTFAQKYAEIVENSISQVTISDSTSLYYPILQSFATLLQSFGYDLIKESNVLAPLFAAELNSLQNS